MSRVRVAWGVACLLALILLGVLIIALLFPFEAAARRRAWIRWWAHQVLVTCHIEVRVAGSLQAHQRGVMLVMNHISWLDIYVVHSFRPARFVAKSEIRSWPVVGYLCDRTGTIFIERGRRRAVHDANHTIAALLEQGEIVVVFPEGTTSDGSVLLPFHANLIQAAIAAGVPVVPLALRYRNRDGSLAGSPAYVGDMSLIESLFAVLRGEQVVAELTVLPPMWADGRTRHQIARAAHDVVAATLGVGAGGISPELLDDLRDELL
jgi:1-acyl-sn-glycerol-3-phosphate acyltransferase